MPIPDFQSLMRPLLRLASDGKEHSMKESVSHLASEFSLSEQERTALLPSGVQPIFTNRVAWTKTHLKMASLLDSTRRGYFQITDLGKKILFENILPGSIIVIDYNQEQFTFQSVASDFKHRIDENGYIILEDSISQY